MKKKKVFVISIIAALLLAGLLFYWNNNEVHACEAVSPEEAREILTEENVLLEYVCWEDVDSEISYKQERSLSEEDVRIELIMCEDGSVYYCSFYHFPQNTLEEVFEPPLGKGLEEKIENNTAYIYYLGKLSTWDMLWCHIGRLCADNNKMYTEEYRYLEHLHMEPALDNTSATIDIEEDTNNKKDEFVYFFNEHENTLVQYFMDKTLYDCFFLIEENGELVHENIHYRYIETRGISKNICVVKIGEMLHDSYFFEKFATMALTEIYTRNNPIILDEDAFIYEEESSDGAVVFTSDYRAEQVVSCEEDVIYSDNEQMFISSLEDLREGRESQLFTEMRLSYFIVMNDSLFAYGVWPGEAVYVLEDDSFVPVLNVSRIWKVQSDGEYLYCSNLSALVRMDIEGNTENLWEHTVYAFTVDENYIYIFDGNTWQVLDRVTGVDLGHIATDVHFTYEMDEIYVSGGKLYFAAWNRENNTISCNSLDMEGNLIQIGEMHEGTEADTRLTTCYEQYIYYVANENEQLVRVNINTGEETVISVADYGISWVCDILIWEDYFVVYGYDGTRCLLCFHPETLTLEEKIYLE